MRAALETDGDYRTFVRGWRQYFLDARDKPFLLGQNDRGWRGDFDFLLREDVVLKMQEGKYDNR